METICDYCRRKKCDKDALTSPMACNRVKWGNVTLPTNKEKYRKTVPLELERSLKSNVRWID